MVFILIFSCNNHGIDEVLVQKITFLTSFGKMSIELIGNHNCLKNFSMGHLIYSFFPTKEANKSLEFVKFLWNYFLLYYSYSLKRAIKSSNHRNKTSTQMFQKMIYITIILTRRDIKLFDLNCLFIYLSSLEPSR